MTKSLRASFGRAIKNLRTSKAMTQQDLAARADISVDYLSKIERGLSSPAFEKIELLADGLGVHPGDIFLISSMLSENPEYDTGTYREVFNNTPEPMFLWAVHPGNRPGNILDANPAARQLTGYGLEELRNTTPIDLLDAQDRGLARTRVRNREDNQSLHRKYTLHDKWGRDIPIVASTKYFRLGDNHMGLTEVQRYPTPSHPPSRTDRNNAFKACVGNNSCMEHISSSILAPLQTARAILDGGDTSSPEQMARCRDMLDQALERMQHIAVLSSLARTAPGLTEQDTPTAILDMVRREMADRYQERQFVSHVQGDLPEDMRLPAQHLKHILTELISLLLRFGSREVHLTIKTCNTSPDEKQQWLEVRMDAFGACLNDRALSAMSSSVNRVCKDCKGTQPKPDVGLCLTQTMVQMLGGSIELGRQGSDGARISVLIPHSHPAQ